MPNHRDAGKEGCELAQLAVPIGMNVQDVDPLRPQEPHDPQDREGRVPHPVAKVKRRAPSLSERVRKVVNPPEGGDPGVEP